MIYLCIFLYVIGIPVYKNWTDLLIKVLHKDLDPVAVHICSVFWPVFTTLYVLDSAIDFIYICNKGEK